MERSSGKTSKASKRKFKDAKLPEDEEVILKKGKGKGKSSTESRSRPIAMGCQPEQNRPKDSENS